MKVAVLVNLEKGKEKSFIEEAKKVEGCIKAVLLTGRFDALVEVEGESFEKIVETVLGKIRNIEGCAKTETMIEVE